MLAAAGGLSGLQLLDGGSSSGGSREVLNCNVWHRHRHSYEKRQRQYTQAKGVLLMCCCNSCTTSH